MIEPQSLAVALALAFAAALLLVSLRPQWIVGFPRSVLVAVALASLLPAAPLVRLDPLGLNLEIDPSTEPLLPSRDPAREVYREAIRDFGDDEVYVIAMVTDDVFRADRLGTLRAVTDRIARFPEVRRVRSLADVVDFRWVPEDEWIDIGRYIDEIPEDAAALEALRSDAVGHTFYRKTLVSSDARTAAINVSFRKMTDREFIASRLDRRVEAVLAEFEGPDVAFHVAGRPHVKAEVYRAMLRDMRLLIPASLAVLAIGLYTIFGTRRAVVLPLGVVSLATLWTFGAMAATGRSVSVLTTLLAPMLVTIGSVYGVHALARYEEDALGASSPRAAALAALRHLRVPTLIAGTTTAAGFAALMITDVPAVFELGAFSVLGVFSTTLLTLTVLPATLTLAPLRATGSGAPGRTEAIARVLDGALDRVAGLTAERPGIWLVGFAAALAVSLALIPRIEIDTDYLSFFDESAPVRRDFEAVNERLSGAVPVYLSLRGEGAAAFREPEALRAIERLQAEAEQVPLVSRTHSMAETVRLMNRAMAADDAEHERIPDTRPAVAELLFMAPKGELDRYTNADHSRANVLVRTGAVGTASVRAVTGGLEGALERAELPDGVEAAVTGNALLLARSADGIARGQPLSITIAVLVILVLTAVGLRSLPLGLVVMAPNLLPVLLFFGLLGAGVAPLSLPTSLIGCVALGVSIDDTVHYLVRYRDERVAGAASALANRTAVRRVGRPIAITSAMLIAGFAVVSLSSFATLRQFGLLSAATMGLCLLADLLLLPALLQRARL